MLFSILHLSNALNKSTIVFGINPEYRVLEKRRVLALTAKIDCHPCNKNETCNESYYQQKNTRYLLKEQYGENKENYKSMKNFY